MVNRLVKPIKSQSFFLFGPRGSGKTTFLKGFFEKDRVLWIDLLDSIQEEHYGRAPGELSKELTSLKGKIEWVVIDEIQKIPKLLDTAHSYIESSGLKFALTGSSARKLKRGAANLLAGRAFLNYLFPLTHRELGDLFNLDKALEWGTLPKIVQLTTDEEKQAFLKSYALTYLKEEVWGEQLIRQLDPFRKFLDVAAQMNGEIINYSNIAKDVGVDTKTVQSYYEILDETLVGILLESYHPSIRKRQRTNPKFYFFDTGVKRALDRTLTQSLLPQTYGYGKAFEHFVILEVHRLNAYREADFRFSYLRTKDDAEVDLIVERPGKPLILIEIKSSDHIQEKDVRILGRFQKDIKDSEAFCFSRDPRPKKMGAVTILPWQEGLREIGL